MIGDCFDLFVDPVGVGKKVNGCCRGLQAVLRQRYYVKMMKNLLLTVPQVEQFPQPVDHQIGPTLTLYIDRMAVAALAGMVRRVDQHVKQCSTRIGKQVRCIGAEDLHTQIGGVVKEPIMFIIWLFQISRISGPVGETGFQFKV